VIHSSWQFFGRSKTVVRFFVEGEKVEVSIESILLQLVMVAGLWCFSDFVVVVDTFCSEVGLLVFECSGGSKSEQVSCTFLSVMSVISSLEVLESLEVLHGVDELVVDEFERGEKMGELEECEDEEDEEDVADDEEVGLRREEFELLGEGETGAESELIGGEAVLSSGWGVWLVVVFACVVVMVESFVRFSFRGVTDGVVPSVMSIGVEVMSSFGRELVVSLLECVLLAVWQDSYTFISSS
jgi:hypothetical protein